MNFAFSEEQEELRSAVRRFLQEKSPSTEVRRLMETTDGFDLRCGTRWRTSSGYRRSRSPRPTGGRGSRYVELTVVFEEMGAALLCAPYFSTIGLAANALLSSDDEAAKTELLPGIADGSTKATFALTEDSGRWDAESVTLAASGGPQWTLDGHKMYVIDGHISRPSAGRRENRGRGESLRS